MRRLILLITSVFASIFGYSQTEFKFNVSAKYQPSDFTWAYELDPNIFRPDQNYHPILQGDLLVQQGLKNGLMKLEGGVNYVNVRSTGDITVVLPDGSKHPASTFTEILHLLGLKTGVGFNLRNRHRKSIMNIILGVQCRIPLSAFSKYKYPEGSFKLPIYGNENFERLTFYGLYLRPTYQFSFAQKRSNPWRFNVYAEADALIHHKSEVNPKFLWGGGLGVSYRLGRAF